MLCSILFGLLAAKAVIASPIAEATRNLTPPDGDSDYDIVWNVNGVDKTLKSSEWEKTLKDHGILTKAPPIDQGYLNFTAEIEVDEDLGPDPKLPNEKRQTCDRTRSTVVTRTETFVDWDVQVSSVACGVQDISISSGWSVANSLSVSGGIEIAAVKDILAASVNVDYTRTWTSTYSQLNRVTIQEGHCGVMILKPLTTRRYGIVRQGCIGSTRQVGTFIADDRLTGRYNGLEWTGGAIASCQKAQNSPPLSRCTGSGNFI